MDPDSNLHHEEKEYNFLPDKIFDFQQKKLAVCFLLKMNHFFCTELHVITFIASMHIAS